MPMLDLSSVTLVDPIVPFLTVSTADPLPEPDSLPKGGGAIAISFTKFSDGRGFTQARRLRLEMGFKGPVVAAGHVIPDQADFLRRCGFSHVEIEAGRLSQWQYSLDIIKIPVSYTHLTLPTILRV